MRRLVALLLVISLAAAACGTSSDTSGSSGQEWLVMMYHDADDELIEGSMVLNVNEAELVGSSDQVAIVVQLDRFAGGYAGADDWSTTRRFHLTRDDDLGVISSEQIADLGEVNMADKAALADFVTWAIETYPADKHALILSNHGAGWPGGWTDQSSEGDSLTLAEIGGALDEALSSTGVGQLELIGMDACLMSSLEVYTALAPYARYAVASEELEPDLGWAYDRFLADLVADPGMDGADLAGSIVEHYITGDVRAAELDEEMAGLITLAAVDLSLVPDVLAALDGLAVTLAAADNTEAAVARSYTQSYYNVFLPGTPPPYLDLGHFAEMLSAEVSDDAVTDAAGDLVAVLGQAVIAEKHGPDRPGSTGITVYFPNSLLYGLAPAGSDSLSYVTLADRFAADTVWDDFLATHYAGQPMPAAGAGDAAVVPADAAITGPGVGDIEIAPIALSSEVFSMGNPVSAETAITGSHVAQVYQVFVSIDEATGQVQLLDFRYEGSDQVREIAGVVYPDWDAETVDGTVGVGGTYWPERWAIFDGQTAVPTLWLPEQFGDADDAIYGIRGYHVSAATGETRFAFMRWSQASRTMLDLYVVSDLGPVVAPFRYTAEPGDQFIVEDTLIDLATAETFSAPGSGVLTFGDEPFWWDWIPADPGLYALGWAAQDMDGNLTIEVTPLTAVLDP